MHTKSLLFALKQPIFVEKRLEKAKISNIFVSKGGVWIERVVSQTGWRLSGRRHDAAPFIPAMACK
jgi:hypothetical protein